MVPAITIACCLVFWWICSLGCNITWNEKYVQLFQLRGIKNKSLDKNMNVLKRCLSTGCVVQPRVYQNFPGVYRGVPDVCYSRTVTLSHICPLLQCSVLTFHRFKNRICRGCSLSVFSRLFVCTVGHMTITCFCTFGLVGAKVNEKLTGRAFCLPKWF